MLPVVPPVFPVVPPVLPVVPPVFPVVPPVLPVVPPVFPVVPPVLPVVPPVLPPPTQVPLVQFLPPLQTVPQLPQLLLSADVLTQLEPHIF